MLSSGQPQWSPVVTFQLLICPEALPDPGIPVHMYSSHPELDACGSSRSHLTITRLPPFRMSVHCAAGYPASELPDVTLEAPWMQVPELEQVVKSLRAIADDLGRGEPVCLAWLEWLRGESLASLSEIAITPDTGRSSIHMNPNGAIVQVRKLTFSGAMEPCYLQGYVLSYTLAVVGRQKSTTDHPHM